MLTNEGFSNRLRSLLGIRPGATVEDVEIIKWGRAFMLPGKTICMVGRQQGENCKLESLTRTQDILLRPANYPGPSCLLLAPAGPHDIEPASSIAAAYSDAPEHALVDVDWRWGSRSGTCRTEAKTKDFFRQMLI